MPSQCISISNLVFDFAKLQNNRKLGNLVVSVINLDGVLSKLISVRLVLCSLPDPPRLEGPLKPNNHLRIAERLYEGKIFGPESIVSDHGGQHIYTSLYQCMSVR